MRLRTKIFLSIIPIVGLALFMTGWLVIKYATKSSHDAIYRYSEGVLDAYITQDLTYRVDILKRNKLDNIPSFRSRYQQEALTAADKLNLIWPGHLLVVDSQKQIIHCTTGDMSGRLPDRWEPILAALKSGNKLRLTGHLPWDDHESFVAQSFKPWDWVVIITIKGDFLHEREQVIWLTVAGIGVLASIVIIVSLGFSMNSLILTPLNHLRHASERIAMEEEEVVIPVETEDELGGLSRDIEGMSYRICQSRKSLQNAYDDLKQLDDMKTSLIANVSHELRTPLTSIIGFTKLCTKKLDRAMKSPTLDSVQDCAVAVRDALSIINDVGEGMAEMIDNIIMLMSLISNDAVANKEQQDLVALVHATSEAQRKKIENKGLYLTFDAPDDSIMIPVDRKMIESVVTHFMDNAIFFTKKGGVGVEVNLHDDQVVVSVRDSGIGMSKEEAKRVFEQFYQGGDVLIDKPKGLGIGLPICKKIIELHGGKIWLNSSPDVGSAFHFSLPVEG